MDKRKIEQSILDRVPPYEEYDSLCELYAQMLAGAKDAAHAITQGMREEVLWEGEAIADHNDYSALHEEHTVLRIIGHGAVAIKGEHFCKNGQRVRVTVQKITILET